MDADQPGRLPDSATSAVAASRKRTGPHSNSDSEDTHIYSLSSEEASDDDDFELVMSRKAKRRNTRTSSSSSTLNERPQQRPATNTILFVPAVPNGNMKRLNRQTVSVLLEALVPNEIVDIRVNTRKNVLAIDVTHAAALNTLRNVTDLDGMKVRSHIPLGSDIVTGVIYDVDSAIPSSDLEVLVKPASEADVIASVTRLGSSRCLKIVFKGDCLPSYVKVGHFRHPVRPFVPKPLQCLKCMRLGHVRSVCENAAVCSRCAETHSADDCRATVLKCSNCHGPHEASSKDCPNMKRELAVLKQMARDHSSHREAAKTIRKRRYRRRRSLKKISVSTASVAYPPAPPPLPPRPVTADRNQNAGKSETAVDAAWPRLPRPQPPAKPQRTSATTNAEPPADKLPEEDKQVIAMLRSMMNAIRVLLGKLKTPSAQSALQVLDALNPVLASLE